MIYRMSKCKNTIVEMDNIKLWTQLLDVSNFLKLFVLELLVEYILDSCSINHMVRGIVLNNHTQKLFLTKLCLYLQPSTSICVGTVLEKVEDASLTKFCSFCATILPLKFDLYFLCLQTDIYKSFHEISSIAILFENKKVCLGYLSRYIKF